MGSASAGECGGGLGAGGAGLSFVSGLGSDNSVTALWVSVMRLGNLQLGHANGPRPPQVPRFCLRVFPSNTSAQFML
jgi:hypothetical protein